MSHFIEPLESRMFLSVSPTVAALHTDEAAVKTNVTAFKKQGATLITTVASDLKEATLQVTDKAQLKALKTSMAQFVAGDARAVAAATAKVNGAVSKLVAARAQLAKKPTSTTLAAKVTADVTALTTVAAAQLSAFNTANGGGSLVTALNALVADAGQIGTDSSAGFTALSNIAQALSTAATKAYSTDVSAIVGP